MKLTILGCNTYEAVADNSCSGYLIEADNKNIIFDFGRGSFNNLLKTNVDYRDIDAIFISHLHADHYADLVLLLHVCIYEPKGMSRYKELNIYIPKGTKKNFDFIIKGFNYDLDFTKTKINFIEYEEKKEIIIGNLIVKAYLVNHSDKIDCYGFRLEFGNKIFSYTGDCSFNESLINITNNADLLLIDSSDSDEKNKGTHLSGRTAAIVGKKSNTKHLVLTHVRNYYKNNVLEDAKKEFSGKISVAKDLMEIDF
jgi:ribonuclease BN (tRNA processing enzyme)